MKAYLVDMFCARCELSLEFQISESLGRRVLVHPHNPTCEYSGRVCEVPTFELTPVDKGT